MSTKTLVAEFAEKKGTEYAVQFKEDGDAATPPISGTMYLKKYAVAQLDGYTGRVRITVEAV